MAAVTLATLDARVRERSDKVNSSFVTSTANSLYAFINEGAQRLHRLLVQKFGDDYVSSQYVFNTQAGLMNYPLPSDFLKLQAIDMQLASASYPIDLKPFTLKERNAYRLATATAYGASVPRYKLNDKNILLLPIPGGVYPVTLWYAPELQVAIHGGGTFANQLVNADDTIDFRNGWESAIVLHAAIEVLKKEESETASLEAELDKLFAEIDTAAENRDAAAPMSAVDMDTADIDPRWIGSR